VSTDAWIAPTRSTAGPCDPTQAPVARPCVVHVACLHPRQQLKRAECADVLAGEYDCILGDREKCRGTFKEIVIYQSSQAYPEYLVYYRRKFEAILHLPESLLRTS